MIEINWLVQFALKVHLVFAVLSLSSIESCPLTKLNGGLSQLHSADDAAGS